MLSLGCPRPVVIPERRPHEVAERESVTVWCKAPDDKWVKCEVQMDPGWWVIPPEIAKPQ